MLSLSDDAVVGVSLPETLRLITGIGSSRFTKASRVNSSMIEPRVAMEPAIALLGKCY